MADRLLTDVLGFFVKSLGGNGAADSGKVAMFSSQGSLQATTNTGAAFYAELPVGSTGHGFTAVASNGIAGYFIANGATGLPLLAHSPLAPDIAHFQGPSGTNNLYIENNTMALRWVMAGVQLKLVPHASGGTLTLPSGTGTLALTSQVDQSVVRYWAVGRMLVSSPTHFADYKNMTQVEVIGDIMAIIPQNGSDIWTLPFMPPRDERFPVWQSLDKRHTMWVAANPYTPGDLMLLLYGDTPNAPYLYGAWGFLSANPGLASVLELLGYEAVNESVLNFDVDAQSFVGVSGTQDIANFHGPEFGVSRGGNYNVDANRTLTFDAQGGIRASTISDVAIRGDAHPQLQGTAIQGTVHEGIAGYFISTGPSGIPMVASATASTYIAQFYNAGGATSLYVQRDTLGLVWKFNSFQTAMQVIPSTANRVITVPDKTGTLAVTVGETLTTTTLAGATTATGQVSLTGQTDAAGTSAMTRDLADFRELINITKFRVCHPGFGANSFRSGGGAQGGEVGPIWVVNAGDPAVAWAKITISAAVQSFSPYSGANIDCARNYDASMVMASYLQLAGAVRVIFGEDSHVVPANAASPPLAGRGWGFEVRVVGGSPKMRLFAHNGTTLVYSGDLAWDGGGMHHIVLRKNAGNLSIYDTTVVGSELSLAAPLGTLAGAPTSGMCIGNSIVLTSVGNGTSASGINYGLMTPDFHIRIY